MPISGTVLRPRSPASATTTPSPWWSTDLCADGLTGDADMHALCCNRSCGVCGGNGCSRRPGGRRGCCLSGVVQARKNNFGLLGEFCNDARDVGCLVRYINVGGNDRTAKRRIDAAFWRRKAVNAFPCCRAAGGACWPGAPRSTLRIAFVAIPYNGKLLGSGVMRGKAIAALLNADASDATSPSRARRKSKVNKVAHLKACGKMNPFAPDGKGYDVYVHVKFPCQRILSWPGTHVWDLVDVAAKR